MSRYENNLIDELRCIAHKEVKDINREDFKTVAEGLSELLTLFQDFEKVVEWQLELAEELRILRRAASKSIEREIAQVKLQQAAAEGPALPVHIIPN